MKKGVFIVALIMVLALLVVPAVAAQPLHKVMYYGKGITADKPGIGYDIIGDRVQFSGIGKQAAGATPPVDGIWKGHGTFVDKDKGFKAKLIVDDGIYCWGDFILYGDADVTINKVSMGKIPFRLNLELSDTGVPQSYELIMYMTPNDPATWFDWYVVSGLKGSKIIIDSY